MPDPNKATWLFNGFSEDSGRAWGFSESWYSGLAGDALVAAMDEVSALRVQILSSDTSIVGYRIGQQGGRAFVIRKNFLPPQQNEGSNLPVDSVQCAVKVAVGTSIKRFFLHDLPDDWIADTAIDPARFPLIKRTVNMYVTQGFQVKYQNQAALQANVLSIDALGNVVTVTPFPVAAQSLVSFLKSRDTNGHAVRGKYIVSAVTDNTHFAIAHWTGQIVGRQGSVRLVQFAFNNAVAIPDKQQSFIAASRKVGRPFFQSRGRVPNRR